MSKSFKKGGGGPGGQVGEKTDQDIRRLKNIVGKVEEASKINLDQMIQNFLSQPELPGINKWIITKLRRVVKLV